MVLMKTLCVIMAAALLAGAGLPARAEAPEGGNAMLVDGINAIVHDSVITYQRVAEYTAPLIGQLRSEYRNQPEQFRAKFTEARDETLKRLVENRLILQDFETGEYNRAGLEGAIETQLQDNIKATYGNRIRFIKTLQAEGRTYEQYRREFRERIIIQQMRHMRGPGDIVVSPHKIELYYVNHPELFREPSQIRLRMILLSKPADDAGQVRKLADEILLKLKEGASFAEMASIYAPDPRHPGGDCGWFKPGELRKELAEAAPALKLGEQSEVIETPEACYLMRVEDRRPEHIKPLNEVRAGIEQVLLSEEGDRIQKQWIERLKKKTFVLYFPNY